MMTLLSIVVFLAYVVPTIMDSFAPRVRRAGR